MKFQHTFEFVIGMPLIVKSLLAEVLPRGVGKTVAFDQLQNTKNPFKMRKFLRYQHTSERIKLTLEEIVKYSDILEYDNLSLLQRVVYRNHLNRIIEEYHTLTEQRDKLAVQLKLYSHNVNLSSIIDETKIRITP